MFSKFKLAKPADVPYRQGPMPYVREQPTDIHVSLPLLEYYDRAIQELRAQNEQLKTQLKTQFHELMKARSEAFELREQLKLLRDEVAQSRLPVDRTKYPVKFNTSKKSYWECEKASRWEKRKKIRGLMLNAVEKLPNEFKPVEIKFNVYGQDLIIPLAITEEMEDSGDDGYTTEVARRILAAKDQGLVSDKAYHELRMALPQDIRCRISPLSAIQKVAETTNQEDSSSEDEAKQCCSEGAIAIYHHEEVEEG